MMEFVSVPFVHATAPSTQPADPRGGGQVVESQAARAIPRRLNLGCGDDVRPGWHNVDVAALPGVDVCDLFALPWSLPSEHYDLVEASHFLEHIPHHMTGSTRDGLVRVMEELHRILRPGGELRVKTPDWRHEIACLSDPTHTRVITPRTWTYFEPVSRLNYYSSARFDLVEHYVSGRDVRGSTRLRFGPSRTALTVHLAERVPGMRRLLGRPFEHTYILRRA